MTKKTLPWISKPPAEVPLAKAPLVRVIAQVQFPVIASVGKQDFIAAFQESIYSDYPILRPEQTPIFIMGPQGMEPQINNIWRFKETDGPWKLSLAPNFLALETETYTSHVDFLARFRKALLSLHKHIDPKVLDRMGIRYINRIKGDAVVRDIPKLVKPQLAGMLDTELAANTQHSVSENLFILPDNIHLMARWGLIPKQGTVDPTTVEPIDELSWLLDMDAALNQQQRFEVEMAMSQAEVLVKHIYGFFRWAVKDEFLKRHGGTP